MKMSLEKSNSNRLIVLEGLPCSGKTTIAKRLVKDLSLVLISELFPPFSLKGLERIKFYLNDLIKSKKSHSKRDCIADRYFLSTIAFEEALDSLIKRKLLNHRISSLYDLEHCHGKKFYSVLLKYKVLRRPDILFYLKILPDVSLKRQSGLERNMSKYNIWRNKKFLSEFQKFCLRNSKKYYKTEPIIINANLPLNEIYLTILERLKRFIK